MRVTHATEPCPGGANEDLVRVGSNWALVLDGAGRYAGRTGGCVHPVTWVVERLAHHLGAELDTRPKAQLSALLHDAIGATMADHGPTCDLSDPLSPGAAVALVRWRADADLLEWLVLSDCAVTIDTTNGQTITVLDDRVDRLPDAPVVDTEVRTYDPEYVATVRNKPGGFWIAGSVPEAASHAHTGQIVLAGVARFLLCSDGVTRLTERYGWTRRDVFALADRDGPAALIKAVRAEENADPDPRRWRGKRHDDATAIYGCRKVDQAS